MEFADGGFGAHSCSPSRAVCRGTFEGTENSLSVLDTGPCDRNISRAHVDGDGGPGRSEDRLYVNLMYVLSDEAGELHLPKDEKKRELSFTNESMQLIRQQILRDARILKDKKAPLSAGWFRQLGELVTAMEVTALQAKLELIQRREMQSASSSVCAASGSA